MEEDEIFNQSQRNNFIFTKKKFYLVLTISILILLIFVGLFGYFIYLNQKTKEIEFGEKIKRENKEIIVCGQYYNIDHPVVLWTDKGGYDAYRVELRFGPFNESSFNISAQNNPEITSPNRFGLRNLNLSSQELDQVRGGGWDLDFLAETVDQFVIHYDQEGTSKTCYYILQDRRDLSVQFMLDVDGTIYQTLDVKERAWHAGIANTRSIGIEIANIGAYPVNGEDPFDKWYKTNSDGKIELILPEDSGVLTPNFTGGPLTQHLVTGVVQGMELKQYDLTPNQYVGLSKLVAVLLKLFPKMKLQFPTENGKLIDRVLNSTELNSFSGILGHFHVSSVKIDPGPAFQWDKLMSDVKKLMGDLDK